MDPLKDLDHEGPAYQYIQSLHLMLWDFIHIYIPDALGDLKENYTKAVQRARKNKEQQQEKLKHKPQLLTGDQVLDWWGTEFARLPPMDTEQFAHIYLLAKGHYAAVGMLQSVELLLKRTVKPGLERKDVFKILATMALEALRQSNSPVHDFQSYVQSIREHLENVEENSPFWDNWMEEALCRALLGLIVMRSLEGEPDLPKAIPELVWG